MLKNYYLSPVRDSCNSAIKYGFWKNDDIQKLPYYRGFVFALYLNALIKSTNLGFSIDNLTNDLLKAGRNQQFSENLFKHIARPYVGISIDDDFYKFIVNGETIDLAYLSEFLPIEKVTYESSKTAYQISSDLNYSNKKAIRKFFQP